MAERSSSALHKSCLLTLHCPIDHPNTHPSSPTASSTWPPAPPASTAPPSSPKASGCTSGRAPWGRPLSGWSCPRPPHGKGKAPPLSPSPGLPATRPASPGPPTRAASGSAATAPSAGWTCASESRAPSLSTHQPGLSTCSPPRRGTGPTGAGPPPPPPPREGPARSSARRRR